MTLTQATKTKAQQLVNDGSVSKIDETTYEVKGSGSSDYEVTLAENNGSNVVWCDAGSCLGFRYHQDCKHCEAVKIFAGVDAEAIVPARDLRMADKAKAIKSGGTGTGGQTKKKNIKKSKTDNQSTPKPKTTYKPQWVFPKGWKK